MPSIAAHRGENLLSEKVFLVWADVNFDSPGCATTTCGSGTPRADVDIYFARLTSSTQDDTMTVDSGFPINLGANVSIGHKVMLHGCSVGDNSLIGINAVILNSARIGKNCLVGASTLITEGKEIPDGSLVFGSPGRVVRSLTDAEIERNFETAGHYVQKSALYRTSLREQRG